MADLTRSEHRSHATAILARIALQNHQPGSPTRQGLLLEAQVHATLALTAPETTETAAAVATVSELPTTKRATRGATRKPTTPAAETATETEKDPAA
jgi:hypothetical protein